MAVWNIIDHTELTAGTTYYDVSSIPSSYDHLCLKISAKSEEASNYAVLTMRINADDGTNYLQQYLTGTDIIYAGETLSSSYIGPLYTLNGTTATVGDDTFSGITIWIPNYANTTLFKPCLVNGNNASLGVGTNQFWTWHSAGLWKNTAAIDQIQLSSSKTGWGSDDFAEHSSFTLYGINGV